MPEGASCPFMILEEPFRLTSAVEVWGCPDPRPHGLQRGTPWGSWGPLSMCMEWSLSSDGKVSKIAKCYSCSNSNSENLPIDWQVKLPWYAIAVFPLMYIVWIINLGCFFFVSKVPSDTPYLSPCTLSAALIRWNIKIQFFCIKLVLSVHWPHAWPLKSLKSTYDLVNWVSLMFWRFCQQEQNSNKNISKFQKYMWRSTQQIETYTILKVLMKCNFDSINTFVADFSGRQ